MRICIDPGHTLEDPGAIGPRGTKEADTMLKLGFMLCQRLQNEELILTEREAGPSERAKMANMLAADLYVSLHANAAHDPSARGVETYYFPHSDKGKRLATLIQNRLVKLGLKDRGVKQTTKLAVIRHTAMPAVLVEYAFISNPQDELLLRRLTFLDKCAEATYKAILEYYYEEEL